MSFVERFSLVFLFAAAIYAALLGLARLGDGVLDSETSRCLDEVSGTAEFSSALDECEKR